MKLEAVTLAAGTGPDPLTVLWLRYRTRLELVQASGVTGGFGRGWLGPARHDAADPRPRALSEWLANDGEQVRAAVVAISEREIPALVADLKGGRPAAQREGQGAEGAAGLEAEAVEGASRLPPEPAAAPDLAEGVRVEFVPTEAPGGGGHKALGILGGLTIGPVVGLGKVFVECGKAFAKGHSDIDGALTVMCALVVAPVGMVVGAGIGGAMGFKFAEEALAKREAARQVEIRRKERELSATASRPDLAAARERTDRALAAAAPEGAMRASVAGAMVARIVEDRDDPELSRLELDLTLAFGEAPAAVERRICLRGPGPIPTGLWLRPDVALLQGAVEAQLSRVVELASWGPGARGGDGPCAAKASPAPPGAQVVSGSR